MLSPKNLVLIIAIKPVRAQQADWASA